MILPLLDQTGEVALHAADQVLLLRKRGLDGGLALPGLGDQLLGLALGHLQLVLAHLDLVLGLLHLAPAARPRRRTCAGRIRPGRSGRRMSQTRARSTVGTVALVGRDQERRQMLLGDPQVALGDLQPAGVLADVGAHLVELRRRPVVRLDGRLQLLVVAVQLGLGLRDLRLLVVDPVRACRAGSGCCGECDDDNEDAGATRGEAIEARRSGPDRNGIGRDSTSFVGWQQRQGLCPFCKQPAALVPRLTRSVRSVIVARRET